MAVTVMVSKKPRVVTYLDPELKTRFEQLCEIRKRSSSNMIEVLIELDVKQAEASGELPVTTDTPA